MSKNVPYTLKRKIKLLANVFHERTTLLRNERQINNSQTIYLHILQFIPQLYFVYGEQCRVWTANRLTPVQPTFHG